jgi:4,5-dihydroxyphthalate decarboxylase
MTTLPSTGPVTLKANLDSRFLPQHAMRHGRIVSPLINFDFCGPPIAHHAFPQMIEKDEFDVGEIAIVTYLQAICAGKPLVILPAVNLGRFLFNTIYVSPDSKLRSPQDLEGRTVGIRSYTQTTGVWIRGMLRHEFGVDPDKIRWACFDPPHLAEFKEPANCFRLPKDNNDIEKLTMSGEVDAMIALDVKDKRLVSLIPDTPEMAQAWYASNGFVPINHILCVRPYVSQQRPDVVREFFRLFVESKKLANLDGIDLVPCGLAANRKSLQTIIDYCFEQKMIPRKLTVDELFDDVTRGLTP